MGRTSTPGSSLSLVTLRGLPERVQVRMVPSSPPVARCTPSLDQLMAVTLALWAVMTTGLARPRRSQTRAVLS